MEKKWKQLLKRLYRQEKKDDREKKKWTETGIVKIVIIFLTGVLLMILSLPSGNLSTKTDSTKKRTEKENIGGIRKQDEIVSDMEQYAQNREKKLEKVLSRVEGIGTVQVMVTIAASEEKEALCQEDSSDSTSNETDSSGGNRSQSSGSEKKDPVLVGEEEKEPYIVQVKLPQIEGVLVVAQGAGTGAVDAEIIAAVQALFPIEPHKIKVMKMGDSSVK